MSKWSTEQINKANVHENKMTRYWFDMGFLIKWQLLQTIRWTRNTNTIEMQGAV